MRFALRFSLVVLFAVFVANSALPASAAAETWSGGDANDSEWMSNDNWSGIGGAGAGDDLLFPPIASRKGTGHNNFAVNTSFNSLSFTGGGYSIVGNQIIMGAGGIDSSVSVAEGAGAHLWPEHSLPRERQPDVQQQW